MACILSLNLGQKYICVCVCSVSYGTEKNVADRVHNITLPRPPRRLRHDDGIVRLNAPECICREKLCFPLASESLAPRDLTGNSARNIFRAAAHKNPTSCAKIQTGYM